MCADNFSSWMYKYHKNADFRCLLLKCETTAVCESVGFMRVCWNVTVKLFLVCCYASV